MTTARNRPLAALLLVLLAGGCAAVAPPPPDIRVLDWSLVRQGDAVTLRGRAANQSARNIHALVIDAVFYGPGGGYLGTITARTEGGSFAPGMVLPFSGPGLWADGMGAPVTLFRDAAGNDLTADTPGPPTGGGS